MDSCIQHHVVLILRKDFVMERSEVLIRVKKTIAKVLERGENEIPDEANFIFDLGADSQQSLELVAAFEEEFDIEMDEDGALEIQTVSGAADFITKYLE